MRMTDDSIACVAKMVQMAILTGTDVVDNLRLMRFVTNEEGQLDPDPEFVEGLEASIQKMLEEANNFASKL
jgi:hypothetical protein